MPYSCKGSELLFVSLTSLPCTIKPSSCSLNISSSQKALFYRHLKSEQISLRINSIPSTYKNIIKLQPFLFPTGKAPPATNRFAQPPHSKRAYQSPSTLNIPNWEKLLRWKNGWFHGHDLLRRRARRILMFAPISQKSLQFKEINCLNGD